MKPQPGATTVLGFVHCFSAVNAFWRMGCSQINNGRIDPVVSPGIVSSHTHTIVGASNIGINSTFDTLFNSECTSCEIEADRSAYWSPLLYFQYANGSFIDVPHGGAVLYYLGRGPNANSTIPFPEGFKMVGGNAFARSYDNATFTWGNATYPGRPVSDAANFVCLPAGNPLPEAYGMTNNGYWEISDCVNGFRAQIHFPTCWNGVDLYRKDQTHVVHLSGIDNGICPPDHPYQLPHLFMEVNYAVEQVPGNTTGGRYVFAQGDVTGYGFHGDFQNGWDMDVQTQAMADCLVPDNFGEIDLCPVLQASHTDGYSSNCPARMSPINERVLGLLDRLPGCITITEGPELASPADMICPSSVTPPFVTPTVNSVRQATVLPDPGDFYPLGTAQEYLGCFNDSAGGVRALNDIAVSNSSMDVPTCQAYCNNRGYRLSGVEYAIECHCSNYITNYAVNGSDSCTWICAGTNARMNGTQEICGGYGYISIYNNTSPSFNASGAQATYGGGGSNTGSGGSPLPTTPLDPYGPNYIGCFSDSVSSRTLQGEFYSSPNMTVQMCATYAKYANDGAGYQYFGVEYSKECYAGPAILSPGQLLTGTSTPSNSTCNMRCGGENSQMCGGSGGISLYNNTYFENLAAKSPIGSYISQGCLTDNPNSGRSLASDQYFYEFMTEDICIAYCQGKGYRFAGVEYGTQCFCGNRIANGGQIVSCSSYDLIACPGRLQQSCGGSNVMNFWTSS